MILAELEDGRLAVLRNDEPVRGGVTVIVIDAETEQEQPMPVPARPATATATATTAPGVNGSTIGGLLTPDHIVIWDDPLSREAVFRQLVRTLADGPAQVDAILDKLREREQIASARSGRFRVLAITSSSRV